MAKRSVNKQSRKHSVLWWLFVSWWWVPIKYTAKFFLFVLKAQSGPSRKEDTKKRLERQATQYHGK